MPLLLADGKGLMLAGTGTLIGRAAHEKGKTRTLADQAAKKSVIGLEASQPAVRAEYNCQRTYAGFTVSAAFAAARRILITTW